MNLKSFAPGGSGEPCAAQGCDRPGEHRAPKSRNDAQIGGTGGHLWFCLEHVRAYNAAWDYFKGMSREDIDRYRREDAAWHRPTWKLGSRGPGAGNDFADPLDIMASVGLAGTARRRYMEDDLSPLNPADIQALRTLELDVTAGKDDIKRAYKRLVKQYHPDANGGDRTFEARLMRVNKAYQHLAASWRS